MFGTGKKIVAGIVVGVAALLAAGCQDTGGGHANHMTGAGVSDKAVMCSKCQVTYFQDSLGKGSPVKYTSSKMECPECKSAAENYFATGTMAHACKACGPDALTVCELHR
jgi:hypothetical protein